MAPAEVRYRYRLRVGASEAAALQAVFDSCRFVWNQALGRWGDLWRHEGVRLSYAGMNAELTDWRSRFDWLAAQPSVPQQQVLRDLNRAIGAFFDKSSPMARPRFKKRRDSYATARWTRNGFKLAGSGLGRAGDRLHVAVGGHRLPIRVVWSRFLPSVPTSVTVSRDAGGHWWASFVCRIEVPDGPVNPTGRSTGLDVGLTVFATTEDPAHDIANPRFAKGSAGIKARADRVLSRTQRGSNNREKARRRRARVHARVANQRADFAQKRARELVGSFDRIGVEDLAVQKMAKKGRGRSKSGLNRAILDAGWASFRRALVWQATKAGKTIVVLPARGTTQTCSSCGTKAKPRIELSDRVFRCWSCGLVEDRDRNAAKNLNPDRTRPGGGAEPSGVVAWGSDGKKTKASVGAVAA